jgi:hypothetical protein
MKKFCLVVSILLVTLFSIPAFCQDIYVDAHKGSDIITSDIIGWGQSLDRPFKTITRAMHVTIDGPTDMRPPKVYVAPGLYNMELGEVFPIRCSYDLIGADRTTTIIDASGSGESAVFCGYGSYIEGFTITGGTAPGSSFESKGGGIFVQYGDYVYIKNCIIKGNKAFYGGGIYTPEYFHIEDCIITENYSEGSGGGLYIGKNFYSQSYQPSWLTNSIIDNNTAGISGAGIYCDASSPMITGCEITNNSIPDSTNWDTYGAGICCSNGSGMQLDRCKVTSNIVHGFGGGIFCSESFAKIVNSQISDNTSIGSNGGGFYLYGGDTIIFNCLINLNTASDKGAGLYLGSNSYADVGNCTISDNFSPIGAGFFNAGVILELYNSIIWNCGDIPYDGDGHSDFMACNRDKDGNFTVDPMFVSGPRGDYYLSQVIAGQSSDSPCLDRGNDMAYLDFPDSFNLNYTTTATNGKHDIAELQRYDSGYHYPSHIDFTLHLNPDSESYSYFNQVDLLLDLDKVGSALAVDVYFVMIDDKGNIFSAPDWKKGITPLATNVMLADKMEFDDMIIRKLNSVDYFGAAMMSPPYDPGPEVTYTYAIAATIAGTTELISNFETIEFTTTLRP